MHTWILTCYFESLVPNEAVHTKTRLKVELHEVLFLLVVVKCVCVDTESLHHAVGSGDTAVGVGPHEHVGGLRVEVLEVPEVVVCCKVELALVTN